MWQHCYPRLEFPAALRDLRSHYCEAMLNRPTDVLHARVEVNMKATKVVREINPSISG